MFVLAPIRHLNFPLGINKCLFHLFFIQQSLKNEVTVLSKPPSAPLILLLCVFPLFSPDRVIVLFRRVNTPQSLSLFICSAMINAHTHTLPLSLSQMVWNSTAHTFLFYYSALLKAGVVLREEEGEEEGVRALEWRRIWKRENDSCLLEAEFNASGLFIYKSN